MPMSDRCLDGGSGREFFPASRMVTFPEAIENVTRSGEVGNSFAEEFLFAKRLKLRRYVVGVWVAIPVGSYFLQVGSHQDRHSFDRFFCLG